MPATAPLSDPDGTSAGEGAKLGAQRPVDLAHLARSTMGDRSLEREVLALFARQATLLLDRMRQAEAASVAGIAHTLKGSARGIGAWQVADAAERLEAARDLDRAAIEAALAVLAGHVADADKFIAAVLSA
jgi:HPt (histidine-containing phosphotransfer) domain-containing protein